MATFDYGIRQALNNKGVDNKRVGYANGYVTVDGKNFMKSDYMNNGKSFTNQQNFNNAWSSFNPTQTNKSPMVQAASNGRSTPQVKYTAPTSPTGNTLDRMNEFINKQAQFQYKAPDPFSYDQNSDPAYQAQLAEAKKSIENQQVDTNAMLRANGQGQSSWSETVANQIGTAGMESIANNLVPQLMQQAYQRYSDDANRNMQLQQMNYGVGQDALGNLSNLYGLQDNEYFQKPITESQVTGNYLPHEARQAINSLLGLKHQAEAKGVTKDQRTQLSQQADVLRSQLQALGIDPRLYGANVTYDAASRNNAGIRTLAGQQLDNQKTQQQWDNKFTQDQFAYQKARDQIKDTQWQQQFDQDVNMNGLQYALNRQVQLGGLSIDQARLALAQDDNARQWVQMDNQMSQQGEQKYGGMTANQVYSAMQSQYKDPITGKIPTDDATKDSIYMQVATAGLPSGVDEQIMTMLGLTPSDIKAMDKKYGVSSGN